MRRERSSQRRKILPVRILSLRRCRGNRRHRRLRRSEMSRNRHCRKSQGQALLLMSGNKSRGESRAFRDLARVHVLQACRTCQRPPLVRRPLARRHGSFRRDHRCHFRANRRLSDRQCPRGLHRARGCRSQALQEANQRQLRQRPSGRFQVIFRAHGPPVRCRHRFPLQVPRRPECGPVFLAQRLLQTPLGHQDRCTPSQACVPTPDRISRFQAQRRLSRGRRRKVRARRANGARAARPRRGSSPRIFRAPCALGGQSVSKSGSPRLR